jgi:hypothetical protein
MVTVPEADAVAVTLAGAVVAVAPEFVEPPVDEPPPLPLLPLPPPDVEAATEIGLDQVPTPAPDTAAMRISKELAGAVPV